MLKIALSYKKFYNNLALFWDVYREGGSGKFFGGKMNWFEVWEVYLNGD